VVAAVVVFLQRLRTFILSRPLDATYNYKRGRMLCENSRQKVCDREEVVIAVELLTVHNYSTQWSLLIRMGIGQPSV
jgi:hypothetical protein